MSEPPGPAARYCPGCGQPLGATRAFVQEYWSAYEQNFVCWCPGCRQQCTVSYGERLVGFEVEH